MLDELCILPGPRESREEARPNIGNFKIVTQVVYKKGDGAWMRQ